MQQTIDTAPVRLVAAVGNDHAGTLYPAAVPATGILIEVVRDMPGKPRSEVLGVLLDWWGCFAPEPGYAVYQGADGLPVDLLDAVERQVRDATGVLRDVAEDWSDGSPAGKLAKELLALMDAGSWSDVVATG